MLIMDDVKVISVNMSMLKPDGGTEMADTVQGTAASELLRGFGGDDVINGDNGADTIIGGAGADKLTGGQRDDIFVFAKGDTTWSLTSDAGVDTILDWEATDRLSFGTHNEVIQYAEQTATSWTAAATTAPQIMASQHLSYLAMQVGADVYVFAAPDGAASSAVESVVKLANTTLDKISADNFLPVGDDRANVLTGGALDERLYGYAGDDTIAGGKGWDLLYGGAGADTFVFAPGDSTFSSTANARIDVIMDWEAGDKLSFAPLGTSFQLTKLTVNSWGEAMTDAAKALGTGYQVFKAYQIYDDVFVFYSPDGAAASIENAVRLMNTTLDKIDLTTFISNAGLSLNGDDTANALTGSIRNDFIDGKGGNDVISGGKGDDVLTGGAGNDLFKFFADEATFNFRMASGDRITDFAAGDKLAFQGAPTTISSDDIFRGTFAQNDAATQLTVDAYVMMHVAGGALSQSYYLVLGIGADTYVVADADRNGGYDHLVILKNFSSSLFTADMITGFA